MKKQSQISHEFFLMKPELFTLDELMDKFIWNQSDIDKYKYAAIKINMKQIILGSWLYTKRERIHRSTLGVENYVDLTMIEFERIILINGAISYLYNLNASNVTKSHILSWLEKLIDWLNRTGAKTPTKVSEAMIIYRDLTMYLNQVAKTHDPKKSNNKMDEDTFGYYQAHKIQSTIRHLLCEVFNAKSFQIEGMTGRIPRLQRKIIDNDVDADSLDEALSYSFQFFEQVANFCLNHEFYPHKIRLLEHEALLVPEFINSIITSQTDVTKDNEKIHYWDFDRGILSSEETSRTLVANSSTYRATRTLKDKNRIMKARLKVLQNKQNALEEANANYQHQYRLNLGLRAMKAYFLVLLDITSMNDSTLATINWVNDDFIEETSDSVKLRNIKRRAGNKEVIFTIQSIFMGSFRTFLRLRRFVLDGYDCDTLFFIGTGSNAKLDGGRKTGGYGVEAYATLHSLYPELKFFGSRTQREHAKGWAMKKTKGQTFLSAAWLQHSPQVSELYYPSESRSDSQDQMGKYLIYQHKVTMEIMDKQLSSSGACNSETATPESDAEMFSIKPDCQKKMTCVFCTHYRIKPVADEMRKLLSMEYVINRHSILHARSQIQFDNVMGPILERIRLLFEAMKNKYPKTKFIIEEIQFDVYEKQNLHWYWEKRLEQLWELGWV